MRVRPSALVRSPLAAACTVAAVTLARQGFEFGLHNNVFHLPIVLGRASLPQFADDQAIQSLAAFATPVYPMLAMVVDEATVQYGFFALHVVTRVLTCLALHGLIGLCGVRDTRLQAAALLVIGLATPSFGYTPVAKAGLFLSFFTHSELAQAVALFALASAAAGAPGTGAAATATVWEGGR